MKRQLPARNVRRVTPRCCATCTSLVVSHGSLACGRPDGPAFETGDRNDLLYVCDRWESAYSNQPGDGRGGEMTQPTGDALAMIAQLQQEAADLRSQLEQARTDAAELRSQLAECRAVAQARGESLGYAEADTDWDTPHRPGKGATR